MNEFIAKLITTYRSRYFSLPNCPNALLLLGMKDADTEASEEDLEQADAFLPGQGCLCVDCEVVGNLIDELEFPARLEAECLCLTEAGHESDCPLNPSRNRR